MCSLPNISELNDCTNEYRVQQQNRRGSRALKRLFSTDSLATKSKSVYELYPSKNYEYSLCGIEFVLKIGQILTSILCCGLYTEGVKNILSYNVSSVLFPNVVFSCSIINTTVIALGYVLGQVMPGVLIRAFNAISIILYFVSACITGLTWVAIARMSYDVSAEEIDADVVLAIRLLLAETFACTLNTGLYSVDLGFSIRKSLRGV